jgi:hypothetical protein
MQREVRPLTEFDERVLGCITTDNPHGVPFFSIIPEYLSGEEISKALQKLKRRGLAVVTTTRGSSRWRAIKRPSVERGELRKAMETASRPDGVQTTEGSVERGERRKAMETALTEIRERAMDHPAFDKVSFDNRDIATIVSEGGDVCDWTMIAILASDALV